MIKNILRDLVFLLKCFYASLQILHTSLLLLLWKDSLCVDCHLIKTA